MPSVALLAASMRECFAVEGHDDLRDGVENAFELLSGLGFLGDVLQGAEQGAASRHGG
jgi:hypothetical protein